MIGKGTYVQETTARTVMGLPETTEEKTATKNFGSPKQIAYPKGGDKT